MIKCSTECNLRSATLQAAEIGLGRGKEKRKGTRAEREGLMSVQSSRGYLDRSSRRYS